MRFVADENLFGLGIGRITSAIQPLLLIVFLCGRKQFEVMGTKDTNRWQLLSLYCKQFIGNVKKFLNLSQFMPSIMGQLNNIFKGFPDYFYGSPSS